MVWNKYYFRKEVGIVASLVISIGLVIWQELGLERVYDVSLMGSDKFSLRIDHSNGGNSVGKVFTMGESPRLTCQVKLSQTFAYCGINLHLSGAQEQEVDLSVYDSLLLEFEYTSNERDTLLVYLDNEEVDKGVSHTRSNMQTLVVQQGNNRALLSLDKFYVPSWWIFSRAEKVSSKPRIDNVSTLSITSGDSTLNRSFDLVLSKVEFRGKWLKHQDLYLSLLIGWVLAGILWLLRRIRILRRKYDKARMREGRLNSINEFLKIERDKYEDMAKHDPLTGCLNRHGLRDLLQEVVEEYSLNKMPASLVLLDLDFFKKINDTYGHEEGDSVLKGIADLVHENARNTDFLIRWGGEEFAILCRYTSLTGAQLLAENLRAVIEKSTLSQHARVTASFGVAEMKSVHVDDWFKQADDALYRAKNEGRNRVVSSA